MNTEEKGSRKKLLVPLVVLLLCAVSLTGAAYAYSSTMINNNNDVDTEYLSIDLASGGLTTDSDVISNPERAIRFTDNYAYTKNDTTTIKTDEVHVEVSTKKVITYNLKVSGDATATTLKVYSSNIDTYLAKTIGTPALSSLFKVYVNIADSMTDAQEVKQGSTDCASFALGKTDSTAKDVTVYVWIQALNAQGAAVQKFESVVGSSTMDGTGDLTASYYKGVFAGYNFALTFEAVE